MSERYGAYLHRTGNYCGSDTCRQCNDITLLTTVASRRAAALRHRCLVCGQPAIVPVCWSCRTPPERTAAGQRVPLIASRMA